MRISDWSSDVCSSDLKTLAAVKRNLLKIFPLVDSSFRIHVIRDKESVTIKDFDRSIMGELCTLITLGDRFAPLIDLVPDSYPKRRKDLVSAQGVKTIPVVMRANDGKDYEYCSTSWAGSEQIGRAHV